MNLAAHWTKWAPALSRLGKRQKLTKPLQASKIRLIERRARDEVVVAWDRAARRLTWQRKKRVLQPHYTIYKISNVAQPQHKRS